MMLRKGMFIIVTVIVASFIVKANAEEMSSFDMLSTGNQKIAKSIFTAQNDSTEKLTLDEIADAKLSGDQGWGNIYKDLQRNGSVDAKNLGQAIKQYKTSHQSTKYHGDDSDIVITNGAGRQVTANKHPGKGNKSGYKHKGHAKKHTYNASRSGHARNSGRAKGKSKFK